MERGSQDIRRVTTGRHSRVSGNKTGVEVGSGSATCWRCPQQAQSSQDEPQFPSGSSSRQPSEHRPLSKSEYAPAAWARNRANRMLAKRRNKYPADVTHIGQKGNYLRQARRRAWSGCRRSAHARPQERRRFQTRIGTRGSGSDPRNSIATRPSACNVSPTRQPPRPSGMRISMRAEPSLEWLT